MKKLTLSICAAFVIAGLAATFFAQTTAPVKKNQRTTATPSPQSSTTPPATTEKTPVKKNGRPTENAASTNDSVKSKPNYFYEFSQPAFIVSKVNIEHDEAGKGQISFVKSTSDEVITDPIEISPAAMERIQAALTALDFMNSTANYQYEKDYSHLGNVTIKIVKPDKTRETKFNWTQVPEAKALADEYRKITNQFIWMFDINLARVNQPLESPKLMDLVDNYVRRNELSDPKQLVPFLKELGNDERMPLIARNHAKRLITQIESAP